MKVIVFFGPPCSGKGTYSKILSEELKIKVIDTGYMIRMEGQNQTEFGLITKELIDKGNLVPDEKLIPKMREWITGMLNENGLIFDGYPRSIMQSIDLIQTVNVDHFIYLNAPVSILQKRMIERSKTSGRADDKIEFFPIRIKNYEEKAQPIIDYFTDLKKLTKFDTSDSINLVYDRIKTLILS